MYFKNVTVSSRQILHIGYLNNNLEHFKKITAFRKRRVSLLIPPKNNKNGEFACYPRNNFSHIESEQAVTVLCKEAKNVNSHGTELLMSNSAKNCETFSVVPNVLKKKARFHVWKFSFNILSELSVFHTAYATLTKTTSEAAISDRYNCQSLLVISRLILFIF